MPHQWFCGGKDPCACMDSWKEAELEKERAQAQRDAFAERMKEFSRQNEAEFRRRLEANVGKAISDDPAKPVLTPLGEEERVEIEQGLWASPHYREMVEQAALENLKRDCQPPTCVHKWAFLRTRSEDAYFDIQGNRVDKGQMWDRWDRYERIKVDVFFCRRCLAYRTKGG